MDSQTPWRLLRVVIVGATTGLLAMDMRLPAGHGIATAADPSGAEIIAAARAVSARPADKSSRVVMRILGPDGDERVRELRGYEKRTPAGRRVLWQFVSPAELAGTSFLAWQDPPDPDELWIYFPGQRRVRRISPGLRREEFQGSAFTYEDMTTVFYLDYEGEHVRVGAENPPEGRCEIVETRLRPGQYAYDRLRTCVRAEDHLPQRIEFYREDELLKTMRVERTDEIEGIPTVVLAEMKNARDGYRTVLEVDRVDYDSGLDDSMFTVGYLSQTGQ